MISLKSEANHEQHSARKLLKSASYLENNVLRNDQIVIDIEK